MHYIRLLRPPSLVAGRQTVLSFVLTITTDLGDSFFSPATPLGISVTLETESGHDLPELPDLPDSDEASTSGQAETATRHHERHVFPIAGAAKQAGGKAQTLAWSSGMRVLKTGVAVPDEAAAQLLDRSVGRRRICFSMRDRHLSMLTAQDVVAGGAQAVVPLWVDVPAAGDAFAHVALRRLCLGVDGQAQAQAQALYVEAEEEMGESIARHVWDAGLATVALVADTCMAGRDRRRRHEADDGGLADALCGLLARTGRLHVLELGSGVGVLGIGLATVLGRPDATVLLTDLAEAEERATANMERAARAGALGGLDYENLDWDEGRRGRFGPKTAAGQPWDLVVLSDCTYNVDMLPALVQTLSALQAAAAATASAPMRVLLARKRRHADEEALFGLLAGHGWEQRACGTVPLPGGDERLEVYLYEK